MRKVDMVPSRLLVVAFLAWLLPNMARAETALAASEICQRVGSTENGNFIQISGILTSIPFLGAPGYGETPKIDKHYTLWILKLDEPLRVIVKKDEFQYAADRAEKEIQVWWQKNEATDRNSYFAMRGKHVVAAGELWAQMFPLEVRHIVIHPTSVRLGVRIACDGSERPTGQ